MPARTCARISNHMHASKKITTSMLSANNEKSTCIAYVDACIRTQEAAPSLCAQRQRTTTIMSFQSVKRALFLLDECHDSGWPHTPHAPLQLRRLGTLQLPLPSLKRSPMLRVSLAQGITSGLYIHSIRSCTDRVLGSAVRSQWPFLLAITQQPNSLASASWPLREQIARKCERSIRERAPGWLNSRLHACHLPGPCFLQKKL
jgi:hypothetical protein